MFEKLRFTRAAEAASIDLEAANVQGESWSNPRGKSCFIRVSYFSDGLDPLEYLQMRSRRRRNRKRTKGEG
jgi:hypothetical protein